MSSGLPHRRQTRKNHQVKFSINKIQGMKLNKKSMKKDPNQNEQQLKE
jgi:hypothetical protein